jgi:hypothetical protein
MSAMLHHFDKLAVTKITWFSERYGHAAANNKAYPKKVDYLISKSKDYA